MSGAANTDYDTRYKFEILKYTAVAGTIHIICPLKHFFFLLMQCFARKYEILHLPIITTTTTTAKNETKYQK